MLKVDLRNNYATAQKPLTTINAVPGNTLKVKATITGKKGDARVVMVETDPLDASNYVEASFGTVNNGAFNADYTISGAIANPKLTLKFVVNGLEDPEGGIIIAANAFFYVDNLTIDNITVNTQNYDDRGKITQNALGQYKYTNTTKPYQNTSVFVNAASNAYYTTRPLQTISYNAFKAPLQIEEQGVDIISFGYNAMQQRSIMYYGNTNTDKLTRPYRQYYSGDGTMEIKATFAPGNTTTPTSVEFITYIGGDAYSAPMVVKSDGTTPNYFYLHRDYQGSIMAVTNAAGAVVEKRLFDPWGGIAKVQDGAGNNLTKLTFFDRGYTGHQHLESVGLIQMNARLYDPKLHRFLQPDNYVQDPYNTQNFNRYAYCLNNPLKYTDASGEEFTMLGAAVAAATIAVVSYLTSCAINHTAITFPGLAYNVVVGSVSGAVTYGIGSATASIGNFWVRAGVEALAHGVFQGSMYSITGGNFWNGFASGAISSIASSMWAGGSSYDTDGNAIAGSGFGGIGGSSGASMIVFGTISGGAAAALTGGNFWQGAVTGLVVSGLNHYMHSNPDERLKRKFNREINKKYGKNGADEVAPCSQATIDDMMNSIDTLDRISNKSENPEMRFIDRFESSNGAEANYLTNAEGTLEGTDAHTGHFVNVFRSSFSSYRHLANNILHELGHAYSRTHGIFLASYKSTGNSWYNAINLDEIYAYTFADYFGISFRNSGFLVPGLQKAINNLNLEKTWK